MTTPAQRAQLLAQLRESAEHLDEERAQALCDAFSPEGAEDVAPLKELLGALTLGFELGESAPDALRAVFIHILADWLVVLRERPAGGLGNLVDQARRAIEDQDRRISLVLDNLGKGDDERDLRIVSGYLRRKPAAMYLKRVERAFPELVAQAQAGRARRTDVTPLVEDAWLLEALRQGGSSREIQSRLDALLARVESLEELLEFALESGSPDAVLVAAALTTYMGRTDDAQNLLVRAARLDQDTAAMATMAARLSPDMTRHTLALLLADAAWANPEEPGHERTQERATALVAMEVVIHRLNGDGSALASPKQLHGFDVSGAPALAQALWQCWSEIKMS